MWAFVLADHKNIKPSSVTNALILEGYSKEYIYLDCIQFILKVRRYLMVCVMRREERSSSCHMLSSSTGCVVYFFHIPYSLPMTGTPVACCCCLFASVSTLIYLCSSLAMLLF